MGVVREKIRQTGVYFNDVRKIVGYNPEGERRAQSVRRVADSLEGKKGIVATGKLFTLDQFILYLAQFPDISDGLKSLKLMDPELSADEIRQLSRGTFVLARQLADKLQVPSDDISYSREKKFEIPAENIVYSGKSEPESSLAMQAAKFKLERIYNQYLRQMREKQGHDPKSNVLFSADVVTSIKSGRISRNMHRMLRTPEQLSNYFDVSDEERKHIDNEILDELEKIYCQGSFMAVWEVAFGATLRGFHRMSSLVIKAKFPKLSRQELVDAYEPLANTGIRLMEIGEEKGIEFFVEGSDGDVEIDADTAHLLIVAKVPPIELIDNLLHVEMKREPARYGLIMRAANNLINRIRFSQGETEEAERDEFGNSDYINLLYSTAVHWWAAEKPEPTSTLIN